MALVIGKWPLFFNLIQAQRNSYMITFADRIDFFLPTLFFTFT